MNPPTGPARSLADAAADYAPAAIEARWQAAWRQSHAFATPAGADERDPAYVLAGSRPCAESLQIGHIRGYTIADAYARFLRARGRAVLFSPGSDALAPSAAARVWQARLRALGCSIDWERSPVSPAPEHGRWIEGPFSALVERGAIYRPGGRAEEWRLRVTAYARDCERELETLPGWDDAALAGQRAVLGRVDGVELEVGTFDGALLTVFTPHPDAIAKAAFVAVSPDHADAERWHTGAFAAVPGVGGMLPIVVAAELSARFGATAVLGIPSRDPADAAIARRLPEPSSTTWKAPKASAPPRPAARWCARDIAISDEEGIWSWLTPCVPPEERSGELPEHAEYARWLPVAQIVRGADAAEETLHQRVLAKALQDAGQLPELPGREPFAKALTCGSIRVDGDAPADLDELLATVGADTLRLAVLYAASPGKAFAWNNQPLRHSRRFLERLHEYAGGRVRDWGPAAASIDRLERLRRRLAKWCGVACEKVTRDLESLQMQRAAHNAMRLLTRIEDFEQRAHARGDGELEPPDREAIVAALRLLARLLAPLTPHIAEELWSPAGERSLLSTAAWPVAGDFRGASPHPTTPSSSAARANAATPANAAAHATPAGTARSRSTAASTASRAS